MTGIIILISLIVFLLINLPVAFAINMTCILFFIMSDVPLTLQIQRMISGHSFTLIAIPLFILAGRLMNSSGITSKLFSFANSIVGHITGGLGHVNVLTSMFMAGTSGSSIADCSVTTKIFVPYMVSNGYSKSFSCAITAASSTIGPIIPPSIIFVVYGWLAGVSIGDLFIAGIIPGVLMGLYLMVAVYIISKKEKFGIGNKNIFNIKKVSNSAKDAILAFFMPIIIIGGIILGIFTPTEAAGSAVLYSFLIGFLVYKAIKLKDLFSILLETTKDTAKIMFIVVAASAFGWIIGLERIPQRIIEFVTSFTQNPYIFLLIINIFFLLIGTIMETSAILIITIPILMPLINSFGINPLHFGVVVSINLLIGALTPPFGVLMYTTCSIAQVTTMDFIRAVWPFYIALILLLLFVTYFPSIVLWLPSIL